MTIICSIQARSVVGLMIPSLNWVRAWTFLGRETISLRRPELCTHDRQVISCCYQTLRYIRLMFLLLLCRKQIQEINMQRKTEQTVAGGKLKQLEER